MVERIPQKLGRERAVVSIEKIKSWYDGLFQYLEKEVADWQAMVKDPRRVFNCDESGFPLSVSSGRVLSPRGARHVYQVVSGSKQQITVLAGMNGAGDYVPPMILYPGQRLREVGMEGFPDALFGCSENGWMDSELFCSFLKYFVAFVKEKQISFPVILFVDGHSTHMTHKAAQYCADNGVILYCLVPNATHILQPCDVGLFSPMKASWKKEVKKWQSEHLGEVFTKKSFAGVFRHTWDNVATIGNAISAFKRSGIFPLSINGIDQSKLTHPEAISKSEISCATSDSQSSSKSLTPIAKQPCLPSLSQAGLAVDTFCGPVSTSSVSMSNVNPFSVIPDDQTPSTSGCNVSVNTSQDHLQSPSLSLNSSTVSVQGKINFTSTPVHSPPNISNSSCSTGPAPRNNDYVSPSFNFLHVPEIKSKRKSNQTRDLLPKALSGKDALAWHQRKAEEKKLEEERKRARKEERELKRKMREEEKEKKHLESLKKKQEREEQKKRKETQKQKRKSKVPKKAASVPDTMSTDSEYEEDIPYMDSEDDEDDYGNININLCYGCGSGEGAENEWVGCDRCPRFWHIKCTNNQHLIAMDNENDIEDYEFICSKC